MYKAKTAHNRTVYAAGAVAPLACVRLGRSATLHSHGSLHPHFASPGHRFAVPLYGLAKRHIQPERYTQFFCPAFAAAPRHPWREKIIVFEIMK
jgi:hypothetical protein